MVVTSVASAFRQYSLLVPVGTPLILRFGATGYRLSDSTGKAIPSDGARTGITFQVPPSETIHTIQLNIVGTIQ
jgi:hypothetical protein